MKITKGDWEASDVVVCKSPYDDHVQVDHLEHPNANRGIIIARFYGHDMKANADIAAEAGTVKNETGYSPRQLAEQKKALLTMCEAAERYITGGSVLAKRLRRQLNEAIAGATN